MLVTAVEAIPYAVPYRRPARFASGALEGADAEAGAREALDAMVRAAREGVETTAPLRSQRGRAAWVQERSEGEPDPGATAYVRFLEALAETLNSRTEGS